MASRPAVIVLAAGEGSRFAGAGHKLAQPLGGSTVLGATLRHAIASELRVVVVTTAALADMARLQVAARDVVVLPDVATAGRDVLGMGRSIAAGVSARPHAACWLMLPADMPMVQPTTMQAVARQLAGHAVAYAQYRGRRGHPVGFSAELYSELVALSGDEGARRLVSRYPSIGVEVDDPGVLVDVDTQSDLDSVRKLAADAAATPSAR